MSIHPSAIVDPKAQIDSTVEVGPFCVIEGSVRIGRGCRLYQGVYLAGETQIGEGCVLHPGVIVGHHPQDTKYDGEPIRCRIGRNSILREHVTVHGGTGEKGTVIGDSAFLLAGAHVAHNCVVGDSVTLINNTLLAGHVHIADRVTFGGGAGAHQFVRIGELVMIAGNATVLMDVPPFALADRDGRVAGLNRIGMRRAEMSRAEVGAVRDAYRTLYGMELPFHKAVERLREAPTESPAVARLVEFLEVDSRRGIAGRSRSTKKEALELE